MRPDSECWLDADADNRSAQVIQIESLGKGAWAILTASVLVSMVAIAIAFRAEARSQISEREARVALDYVTSVQVELARNGTLIKPPSGH